MLKGGFGADTIIGGGGEDRCNGGDGPADSCKSCEIVRRCETLVEPSPSPTTPTPTPVPTSIP